MDNDELLIAIKDMFDKKIDEVKNEVNEVKNHMEVIAESLKIDIKAAAEGHSILDRKFDSLQNDVNELKKDMPLVKNYVIGIDAKLNEHETILKRVK